MCLALRRVVHVVMVERARRCVYVGKASSVTAKGAHGNATEELFVRAVVALRPSAFVVRGGLQRRHPTAEGRGEGAEQRLSRRLLAVGEVVAGESTGVTRRWCCCWWRTDAVGKASSVTAKGAHGDVTEERFVQAVVALRPRALQRYSQGCYTHGQYRQSSCWMTYRRRGGSTSQSSREDQLADRTPAAHRAQRGGGRPPLGMGGPFPGRRVRSGGWAGTPRGRCANGPAIGASRTACPCGAILWVGTSRGPASSRGQ